MHLKLSVFAALLYSVSPAFVVHDCHDAVKFNPENNFSVLDGNASSYLVNSVSNGSMYMITIPGGSSSDASSFYLLHLYGTPYEMGFAQGTLAADQMTVFFASAWEYMVEQATELGDTFLPSWLVSLIAELGLEGALEATMYITEPFTPQYVYDEIRGLADGSGIDYNRILMMHQLAGFTQGHCSLFGAWGSATVSGDTLFMRALDWDMDGPFRDYTAIQVYHPSGVGSEGMMPHVIVGMLGWMGALTGINQAHVAVGEIGVSYPGPSFGAESRVGVPFIFQMRNMVAFDTSLQAATKRMEDTQRTCDLVMGVGDPSIVNGFVYSWSTLLPMNNTNMRPVNSSWHFRIPNMVYWGMDWYCPAYNYVLGTQLSKFQGTLTPQIAIQSVVGPLGSGANHVGIFDLTTGEMWISFAANTTATGNVNAWARQYVYFDADALMETPNA